MKAKWLCLALLYPTGLAASLGAPLRQHNYMPPRGYVPDARTAIRIAVAVWSPIYGEKNIQNKKPFKARLSKGVWTVEGSLRGGVRTKGGVPIAEISRRDGRVLRVSHGR